MRSFITISLFLILSCATHAQSVDQTYRMGVEAFERGNHDQSIPLFRRVLFFGGEEFRFDACHMLASSYSELGTYESAHKFLDLAYRNCNDDSLRQEIVFEKSVLFLLEEKYNYALMELYNVDTQTRYFKAKYEFYMGVINFRQGDYDQAQINLNNCLLQDSLAMAQLQILFEQNEEVNKINPRKARNLSYIFPGLGQLYVGDYENALNSFLINAAFLTLYFEVAFSYSLLDGFLSILPWFNRYYLGGATKAKEIANRKIIEERNAVFSDIIQFIADYKVGKSQSQKSKSHPDYE